MAKKAHTTEAVAHILGKVTAAGLLRAADRAHRKYLYEAEKAGTLLPHEQEELRGLRAADELVRKAFAKFEVLLAQTTVKTAASPSPPPPQPATVGLEKQKSAPVKLTLAAWLPDAVSRHPPQEGEKDYAGRLLPHAPKAWTKKSIQNELSRLAKERPDLCIPKRIPKIPKRIPKRIPK
jgi:hypothetical protein